MKKIIDFCSTLPFVQRKTDRYLRKYKEYPNYTEFKLVNIFKYHKLIDSIMLFFPDCILLKMYEKDKVKYGDFVFETKKRQWDMHPNGWNWYEIPLYKINENNENIIFDLIKKSYEISYESLKETHDLNKKVYDIDIYDEALLNAYIEFKNIKHLKYILTDNKRDSILLIENKNKRAFKGNSKLGGSPDLPVGLSWPQFENKPLTFVAQINLSEINNLNLLLPKTGMLYFFMAVTNHDDDYYDFLDVISVPGSVQVLYSNLPKEGLKKRISNNFKFNELVLNMKVVAAYPESNDEPLFKKYTLTNNDIDSVTDVADMYYETIDYKYNITNHHNLLGYYRPVQYLSKEAQDYIPLLQISSSEDMNMDWGDGGILYIHIKKEDLINLDFSKIIVETQCG